MSFSTMLTPLAALASIPAVPAASPPPVVMQALDTQLPYRPTPVRIGNTRHLVYELHLTNFSSAPLTIDDVTVGDGASGTTLLHLSGSALTAALGHVPSGGGAALAPGARIIVYLDVPLSGAATPSALTHRVSVASATAASAIDAGTVAVDPRPLPVLGPPLRGGPWVAVYAPEMERGHRRVLYATAGRATIPGRFAIDWMKVDKAGRFDRSDGVTLADSHSYGADVLAVADAVVAAARDDFTEPMLRADLPKVAIGDATGNYVALDLGDGRFAFYEHLQPGVKVKPGDRVKRGEVIGRIGLTGQGSRPHLHFHVASSPSPLAAEGLPFLLGTFETLGRYASIGDLGSAPWPAARSITPGPALPAANSVVRFPE